MFCMPYTDIHTLNLDWIIGQVKTIPDQIRAEVAKIVVPSADTYASYTDALSANLPVGSVFAVSSFRPNDGHYCVYEVTNGPGVVYRAHYASPVVAEVTPENYGAWGDGIHDDTEACRLWLDSGRALWARGEYLITDGLTTTSDVCIMGGGGTFVRALRAARNFFQLDGVFNIVYNINMRDEGGLANHSAGWIRTATACKLVHFSGVNIRALVHGQAGEGGWALGLAGDMIVVDHCTINTSAFGEWGDGIHVTRAGVVYIDGCQIDSGDDGIALLPQDLGGNVPPNYGSIDRAYISNCRINANGFSAVKFGVYVDDQTVECGDLFITDSQLTGVRVLTYTDRRAGYAGGGMTVTVDGCHMVTTGTNRPIFLECTADSTCKAIFRDCVISDTFTQEPMCSVRSAARVEFDNCRIDCRTVAYFATADDMHLVSFRACDITPTARLIDGQLNFEAVGCVIRGAGDGSNIFYKTAGECVFCNNVLLNSAKFYSTVGTCAGNVGGANSYSKTVTVNNGTFTIA